MQNSLFMESWTWNLLRLDCDFLISLGSTDQDLCANSFLLPLFMNKVLFCLQLVLHYCGRWSNCNGCYTNFRLYNIYCLVGQPQLVSEAMRTKVCRASAAFLNTRLGIQVSLLASLLSLLRAARAPRRLRHCVLMSRPGQFSSCGGHRNFCIKFCTKRNRTTETMLVLMVVVATSGVAYGCKKIGSQQNIASAISCFSLEEDCFKEAVQTFSDGFVSVDRKFGVTHNDLEN